MFHGGRSFIRALALAAAKSPVLGKGHSVLGEAPASEDPEEGVSLCRNPWALAGGKKVGQSWSNPALEPCPVCWEGVCSEPCGCCVKIINRAIKEAPAALMLCGAGRRAQLGRGEGLLSTPFSCQIPSQLLGWVSEPGAGPGLVGAVPSAPARSSVPVRVALQAFPALRVNKVISTRLWLRVALWEWGQEPFPDAGSAQG